jgi:hypothetical protein
VGREQSGEATVAVRDWVDRQEIQDQRADQQERMGAGLALGILVANQQIAQQELRLLWVPRARSSFPRRSAIDLACGQGTGWL